MLLNHLIISCLVIISPLFPPVIIPITYTLIGIRLLQGAHPIILSLATVLPAIMSSILIWVLYGYIHGKIHRFKEKRENKDRISQLKNRYARYIENKKGLRKMNKKILTYLERKDSKFIIFLLTILALDSAIPDIIVIGLVRKRISLPLFVLATIVGKSTVYLPIIRA
jgi:membrane protein YqaA with SNARE-associated domain